VADHLVEPFEPPRLVFDGSRISFHECIDSCLGEDRNGLIDLSYAPKNLTQAWF